MNIFGRKQFEVFFFKENNGSVPFFISWEESKIKFHIKIIGK